MKHYTETISPDLAEKLKAAGMSIETRPLYAQEAPNARGIVRAGVGIYCPSYAEVFDWMMEKGYDVEAYLSMTRTCKDGATQRLYAWIVNTPSSVNEATSRDMEYDTWHEAANKAIEKALELITEDRINNGGQEMKTLEERAMELFKRIIYAYTNGETLDDMTKVATSYLQTENPKKD